MYFTHLLKQIKMKIGFESYHSLVKPSPPNPVLYWYPLYIKQLILNWNCVFMNFVIWLNSLKQQNIRKPYVSVFHRLIVSFVSFFFHSSTHFCFWETRCNTMPQYLQFYYLYFVSSIYVPYENGQNLLLSTIKSLIFKHVFKSKWKLSCYPFNIYNKF